MLQFNHQHTENNMTLVQAQQRYIDRVKNCHPGHQRRVGKAAWSELFKWAAKHGMDARAVCQDAKDVAELEQVCKD
jgi:hypothetical protein